MRVSRTPAWSEGMFEGESLFGDVHTQPLATYLREEAPYLLQQWFWVVRPLAIQAKQEKQCLNELKLQRRSLKELNYQQETSVDRIFVRAFKSLRMMPKASHQSQNWLTMLLSLGLSFQQFIAISELLGVQIEAIRSEDIALLLLSGTAAISLTLAAKEGIIRWVRATKWAEPEQIYPHGVPFWKRLQAGDTLCWCTVLIVVGEAAFASPGFLALLPPRLAAETSYQVVAFLFSGLAAYINVFLAWGIGLEENAQKRSNVPAVNVEYLEGSEQPDRSPESTSRFSTIRSPNIRQLNRSYTQDIKEQKKAVREAERLAGNAHRQWSRAVKRLMQLKERNRPQPSRINPFYK